jgi:hypothetical protein
VEAAFHLTGNFAYPLMLLLSLLMFPAMVIRYDMGLVEMLLVDVPLFMGATTSIFSFYAFAQRQVYGQGNWRKRLRYIPGVLALGIGLSVNNTRAVLEGLFGKSSDFVRTPKLGLIDASDGRRGRTYRGPMNWAAWAELALGIYFSVLSIYALAHGLFASLPFILIFQTGYLYIALLSLFQEFERLTQVRALEA